MLAEPRLRIAVFCKAPVAGQVKTRLIPAFGAAGATAIYRELAERTLDTVAAVRDRLGAASAQATLWVAGDAGHPAILDWARRYAMPVHRQHGADLGERMQHCLQTLTAGGGAALLVGTDCPALRRDDLIAAATALSGNAPWVFTPAEDGGYVLVGGTAPDATPFAGIAWSTATVMAETRAALSAAGVRWVETEPRWDVDEPADVERAIAAGLLRRP